MTKLGLVKLLELRGITELEQGQSVGQAIRESGGEPRKDELLEVLRLCTIHYSEKIEKLESHVKQLDKQNDSMRDDVAFLRCLEAAGVDNWSGYEIAGEIYEEEQN